MSRRVPSVLAFAPQINDALIRQKQRMDLAFVAEQDARRLRREAVKIKQESTKHPMEAESSEQAAKRARTEIAMGSGKGKGPEIDVSSYPLDAVVDVVMTGLNAVSVESLKATFDVSQGSRYSLMSQRLRDKPLRTKVRMLYLCWLIH